MDNNFRKFEETAEFMKIMAHPVRLCILNGLYHNGGCNVSNMIECLGLPQSTISTHLAKLRSSGALVTERRATEIFYKIGDPRIIDILKVITTEEGENE